jgi:energy-converting hydrogenase Eha subunit F
MNEIARYLRGFANVFVSGILLMLAIVNMNWILDTPHKEVPHPITISGIFSLLFYLALILVTGLFAWAFWRRRTTDNPSYTSAILNALACILFVTATVYAIAAK